MAHTESWGLVYRSSRTVVDWQAPVEAPGGGQIRCTICGLTPDEMRHLAADRQRKGMVAKGLQMPAERYRRFPPSGEFRLRERRPEEVPDRAVEVRKSPGKN